MDYEIRFWNALRLTELMVAADRSHGMREWLLFCREQPEVYPDKFAPQDSDRAWIPKSNQYVIPAQARPPSTLPEPHPTATGNTYDLPALIDIALRNNPDTRVT